MTEDKACRELEPCPFCGAGSDRIILQEHEPHTHAIATFMPDHPGSATIECGGCNVGMIEDTVEEVITAWNRRAAKPAVPDGFVRHPIEQVTTWADMIKRQGGQALIVQMLESYAALLSAATPLPAAQRVPEGYVLVGPGTIQVNGGFANFTKQQIKVAERLASLLLAAPTPPAAPKEPT